MPTIRFLKADGVLLSEFTGVVSTSDVIQKFQDAQSAHGPIQLSKAYRKILRRTLKIERALGKKAYSTALKEISALEKLRDKGPDLVRALKQRKSIEKIA